VCTHQKILTIEEWDIPNPIQNIATKIKKDNKKTKKIDRSLSQTLTSRLKHDKIQE